MYNWLQQLDCPQAGLNVEIIIMSLLFHSVQRFFELILSVGNEARILRSPGRMRCPFVVEDCLAHFISPTAVFEPRTFRE